jgi:putative transposase
LGLHADPGVLKNLGHRVGRSTVAKILKDEGIPPSRQRPMTWRTFLRAHWPALVAADFFTTEVWTARGLVTYYTLFVIELHSRRVHLLGSTPHPDEAFVIQTMREVTDDVDHVLRAGGVLICDRDRKWSPDVDRFLGTAHVRMIRTPVLAPNCNAYAERFVRSIKEECLNRVIPLGERHLRRTLSDFAAHYHGERNHQGLGHELIAPAQRPRSTGFVRRRQRIGGLLNYYCRAAAGSKDYNRGQVYGHYGGTDPGSIRNVARGPRSGTRAGPGRALPSQAPPQPIRPLSQAPGSSCFGSASLDQRR